jgi:peroxiredoxin
VWQRYRDQGVVVWGIASRESEPTVQRYVDHLGLTYPILLDRDGRVNEQSAMEMAFPSAAYPQDWVIGADGTVVYASNEFHLDAIQTAVESELPP